LGRPGLGVWTVRDLVGHTCRALTTVEAYAARPAARVELERPVDYMMRAMDSLGNPAQWRNEAARSGWS
jgi:hypothetical protein